MRDMLEDMAEFLANDLTLILRRFTTTFRNHLEVETLINVLLHLRQKPSPGLISALEAILLQLDLSWINPNQNQFDLTSKVLGVILLIVSAFDGSRPSNGDNDGDKATFHGSSGRSGQAGADHLSVSNAGQPEWPEGAITRFVLGKNRLVQSAIFVNVMDLELNETVFCSGGAEETSHFRYNFSTFTSLIRVRFEENSLSFFF